MTGKPIKKDTKFAPGNPGGPGRPPLSGEAKEARRLNKTEFENVVNKYLWCPLIDLKMHASDQSLPTMEAWVVAIMLRGITTGDWGGQEWIAQRIMGKVKDQLEVKNVTPFVIKHADGSQTVLGAKTEIDEE